MGNATSKKGDSWFTGETKGATTQEVTAAAGTTLYFMCAVHPWMHGQSQGRRAGRPLPDRLG